MIRLFKNNARCSALSGKLGTDHALSSPQEAYKFCKKHGVPVMLKAAYGGGGRGMRVVKQLGDVEEQFQRAQVFVMHFWPQLSRNLLGAHICNAICKKN